MREKKFDLTVLAAAGTFYLVNRLWLSHAAGWPGWFLSCYANDIFAGAAITAWADLLLRLGGLTPIRSWRRTVPLLLACGLVWEVLAPLWKPEAVFDPWDFLAYQAGGALWLACAPGAGESTPPPGRSGCKSP